MSVLHFHIAGPVQGKARPRATIRNGRPHIYTPTKTEKYEHRLAQHAQIAMRGRPPYEGPLELHVEVGCECPKSWSKAKRARALLGFIRPTVKPDASNIAKAIEDAMNKIVYEDDVQIVDLRVKKYYTERPFVTVTVCPTFNPLQAKDPACSSSITQQSLSTT